MSIILVIIVLLLIFGAGGGWYGYRTGWYGPNRPVAGPGFNPMSIIWIVLTIILIVWLVEELGVIRFR
jgi:hypothetical protein